MGKAIGDVIPALAGELDSKQAVRVWCPGQPFTPFRAVSSRPSGRTFEWFVAFDRECDYRTAVALLEGADRERVDLAEALHEGPYQIMTAVLLHLGKLKTLHDADIIEDIDGLRTLVEAASDSLRGVTLALRPPRGPGGLRLQLASLAEILGRHLHMQVTVPLKDEGQYPPLVEAAAGDAVQAALMFAWTHSVAHANVSLHQSTSQLRVLIEFEDFKGQLSRCTEGIQSQDFIDARGVVVAEMESDTATIALCFPLDTAGTTKLS